MILLTPDLRFALRANAINRRAAVAATRLQPDQVPVVKFFNPLGAATWIATELLSGWRYAVRARGFGLWVPELGVFSLSEIERVRLPLGLRIERDIGFETSHPLSLWAKAARVAGSISAAKQILNRTVRPSGNELPPAGG